MGRNSWLHLITRDTSGSSGWEGKGPNSNPWRMAAQTTRERMDRAFCCTGSITGVEPATLHFQKPGSITHHLPMLVFNRMAFVVLRPVACTFSRLGCLESCTGSRISPRGPSGHRAQVDRETWVCVCVWIEAAGLYKTTLQKYNQCLKIYIFLGNKTGYVQSLQLNRKLFTSIMH